MCLYAAILIHYVDLRGNFGVDEIRRSAKVYHHWRPSFSFGAKFVRKHENVRQLVRNEKIVYAHRLAATFFFKVMRLGARNGSLVPVLRVGNSPMDSLPEVERGQLRCLAQ